MPYSLISLAIVAVFFLLVSCDPVTDRVALDGDGLTPEVRQIVPSEVLDRLVEVGMPIHGGANPPDVTGTFFLSPLILTSSSLLGDTLPLGTVIDGRYFDFKEQSDDLALSASFGTVPSGGRRADRSFIVGRGCRFTVFSEYLNVNAAGHPWSNLTVVSGCLTESGIEDAVFTNVLLEDRDQIFGEGWLPGQGRLFSDGDGVAERQ
ncbi:hypothetical protein [Lewinella sp. IMCC34183]|uniref:hypothetical protein n=1 Tax=Lewinella sp. IMCC34183 TaxID=2248762 RepID=UPI000E22B80B|nr:hypothetical protein [Lewinella sp. IMCC34183]